MTAIPNCPYGFEDGHIVGYRSNSSRLNVEYEFWNEHHGWLVFDGLIGMRDNSAIGVTIGLVSEADDSEFLRLLIRRRFENTPNGLRWTSYQFLDLDDATMFEVVAESCTYVKQIS